jgi:hypothetical protein
MNYVAWLMKNIVSSFGVKSDENRRPSWKKKKKTFSDSLNYELSTGT